MAHLARETAEGEVIHATIHGCEALGIVLLLEGSAVSSRPRQEAAASRVSAMKAGAFVCVPSTRDLYTGSQVWQQPNLAYCSISREQHAGAIRTLCVARIVSRRLPLSNSTSVVEPVLCDVNEMRRKYVRFGSLFPLMRQVLANHNVVRNKIICRPLSQSHRASHRSQLITSPTTNSVAQLSTSPRF